MPAAGLAATRLPEWRWRSSEVENASAVCLGDCLAASAVGGVGGAAEARALSRVALIEAIELSEAVEAAVEAGAPPQSSRPSLANARDGRAEMALEAPLVAVARSIVAAAAASGASVVAVTAGAGVHEAIDEAADDARAANPTAVVETATAPPIPVETVTKVTAPAPPAKRSEATPPQPAARAEPVEDSSPSVRVEKTRWHPKPHRRDAMVAVDGAAAQRVHEGDVVGRLVVTEIEPSGVLFERDGQKLRRRIGESSP